MQDQRSAGREPDAPCRHRVAKCIRYEELLPEPKRVLQRSPAGFCCKWPMANEPVNRSKAAGRVLCSDSVDLMYEPDLADHVTLLQPADLTFSDHVHRLISGDRVHRAAHGSKPQAGGDSLFDETVILFQHVVHVR